MAPPKFKLNYFEGRGRAEAIRLVFVQAHVAYEDNRISDDDWPNEKPKMPFGQMPALEVDGKFMTQSKAICRYLAKQFKLAGKTDFEAAIADGYVDQVEDLISNLLAWKQEEDEEKKKLMWETFAEEHYKPFLVKFEKVLKDNGTGYLVGKELTWADLYLFDYLTNIYNSKHAEYYDTHPKLIEFIKKIENLPKIKIWIEKRPKSDY